MSINNSQQISDIKTMLVKGMNGEGIESIEKTATEGFIDTYTITYTDGTKTTFDVTNGNWGIWTSAVTAAQGATSVTINNDAIGTTSILEVYSENASGSVVTVNDIDVSAGTAVLSFPALAEATAFILHIINGTASGGGGVATDDYLDLNNKPQINGITLTGNKTTADFGLVNTFLGDLTEWNALSTDEKKMYDHASITGTGGGEYNVNRSTGNLVLTAGVPTTYPASQVMMSDDVTSVESVLDGLSASGYAISVNTNNVQKQTARITKSGKDLIISLCFTTLTAGTSIGSITFNNQAVTLAARAYCVTASNGTGQVVEISTNGNIAFITGPVVSTWYNIVFIVTLA